MDILITFNNDNYKENSEVKEATQDDFDNW